MEGTTVVASAADVAYSGNDPPDRRGKGQRSLVGRIMD
jgi:hypothetical protein